MTAGQAYEHGLITVDEFATCVLAAAEREIRRDFFKQSGEVMGEDDYKFTIVSSEANDVSNMILTVQVRDTSMFSYTNFAVVYAHVTNKDQHWTLKHIVQFLEQDPYVVHIENSDIPLTSDSPEPKAWPAEEELPQYGDAGVNPNGEGDHITSGPTAIKPNEPPRFPVRISSPDGIGTMNIFVVTIDDGPMATASGKTVNIGEVVCVSDDCASVAEPTQWDAEGTHYYTLEECLDNAETLVERDLFRCAASYSLKAHADWWQQKPKTTA